ncbi:MAG: alanine--tRNA ligase [Patescibacteria group bacterium]|nr:alanine--tRNA ligase [Patescibacteria group bacterium]
MTSKEIREKYLEFFKSKGHVIIPSASLIPEDSTTLFIGSGMQPLVPYLLGKKHPKGTKLTNSQKCFRAEDIEEVGDNRHTTFFEMLGNWSLGDYFKKEQLSWYFEFLIKELKINPEKLYVTVFRGNKDIGIDKDSESVEIWKKLFKQVDIEAEDVDFAEKNGIKDGRIFYYDETKNWWSRSGMPKNMPVGELGGPDSEVFYDLGVELKRHENSEYKGKVCHINCDCGRFIEIGNSVFMEYVKTEKGFEQLEQKNVDFGGGLERTTIVVQGKDNAFETDLFIDVINEIKNLSGGKEYRDNVKSFEVIADHIRGTVFLASEDVIPSNTERGYILRRLIRRAIRFGKLISMPKNFLIPLAEKVIETYKDVYTKTKSEEKNILTIIQDEEEKFGKTLNQGLKQFEKVAEKGDVSGIDAFHLYDTYGFPLELTEELSREKGLKVDKPGFKKAFEKHQEVSRAGAEKKFGGIGKEAGYEATKLHTATHLLHQALRDVLGDSVKQMGSDITHERLRFDFSYSKKLTENEIKEVEGLVNKKIKEDSKVEKKEMNYSDAIKSGALAFFKEKYPDKVTVYSIDKFSKEICAGPHVKKTGELGSFKIIKEKSVGVGIRRIRAVIE